MLVHFYILTELPSMFVTEGFSVAITTPSDLNIAKVSSLYHALTKIEYLTFSRSRIPEMNRKVSEIPIPSPWKSTSYKGNMKITNLVSL